MNAKTIDLDEAWEDGSLGRDADHVAVADDSFARQVDEAVGLQPISIRLPKSLIEQLKLIARCHGIGYLVPRGGLSRYLVIGWVLAISLNLLPVAVPPRLGC